MWIQISSGTGPDECALAVGLFYKTLLKEWEGQGINATVLSSVAGNHPGTFKSIVLSLTGDDLEPLLQTLRGTVCWSCQSPYRPKHKRKNWFIDVDVFHAQEKLSFSERDVVIAFTKSAGPGGQNVNKVETAVRATHLPTGLTVTASEERSQLLNKKLAFARLSQQLTAKNALQALADKRSMWSQHNALLRGNPIRIYEGRAFRLKYRIQ